MSEGVVIGVRNAHIAIMNNPETNEKDYGVPIKVAKTINLKVSPKVNSATLYADDGPSETASSLGEIDVELEIDKLTSDKQVIMLGSKKDTNGVLISSADDLPPYLALGFQVPTTVGFKFTWLYKGKFEPVSEEYKTQGDKVDFQTPKAKATFIKRAIDNRWKASVSTGDEGVTQGLLDNWFNAVYDGASDISALTVVVTPANAATGVLATTDIRLTFNKAIKSDTINAMNVFLMKSDASTVATTVSVDATNKIVTLHPTVNLVTGNYIAVCTTGIKDITNLSLVQNSITTFTV